MAHNCQKLRFLFLSHLPSACPLLSRLSQHVGRQLKLQSLWPKLFPGRGKKWSQGMGWYFQLLSAFLIIFLKVLHKISFTTCFGKNLVLFLWPYLAAKEVGKFRRLVLKRKQVGVFFWKKCYCYTTIMVALETLF